MYLNGVTLLCKNVLCSLLTFVLKQKLIFALNWDVVEFGLISDWSFKDVREVLSGLNRDGTVSCSWHLQFYWSGAFQIFLRSAASGIYSLLETSENSAEAQIKSCWALGSDENMQWWFLSRLSIELQWNLLSARSGSVSCQSAVVPSSWISQTPCFLLSFSSSVLLLMLNPNSAPVRTRGLGGVPVSRPEPEFINSITAVTKTSRSSFNVHPRRVWHAFQIRSVLTLSFTFSEEFEDFPI